MCLKAWAGWGGDGGSGRMMDNYDVSLFNDTEIRSRLFPMGQRRAPDVQRFKDYGHHNDVVIIHTFFFHRCKLKKPTYDKPMNNQGVTHVLDLGEHSISRLCSVSVLKLYLKTLNFTE